MFYIIEKVEQLGRIERMNEGFVDIIPYNYNFHPKLQTDKISLVYVKSFAQYSKGYIICIKHNESLSLSWETVQVCLKEKIKRIFVLDKKNSLYYFKANEVCDLNFIEVLKGNTPIKIPENRTINHFYNKLSNYAELNCIIPISKHYEQKEELFEIIKDIKGSPFRLTEQYELNNKLFTEIYHEIESEGIKLSRDDFVEHYKNLEYPEYNICAGTIYTHFNLYTTTGRPSNSYNEINFAALNKTNGERNSFQAQEGCQLVEFDINGMHPRIISKLINSYIPPSENVYEYLKIPKEEMFANIYGGIKKEYRDKPFFREIIKYTDDAWNNLQYHNTYNKSPLRIFYEKTVGNSQKLFNYIIQSYETIYNISYITLINNYLKENKKKSKIILTTYDSYLLNYDETDGVECLDSIKKILPKSKVTSGKYYGRMEQYEF